MRLSSLRTYANVDTWHPLVLANLQKLFIGKNHFFKKVLPLFVEQSESGFCHRLDILHLIYALYRPYTVHTHMQKYIHLPPILTHHIKLWTLLKTVHGWHNLVWDRCATIFLCSVDIAKCAADLGLNCVFIFRGFFASGFNVIFVIAFNFNTPLSSTTVLSPSFFHFFV